MSATVALIFLVFSTYWILLRLGKFRKSAESGIKTRNDPAVVASEVQGPAAVDLGAIGSLKLAWEMKGALWDEIPVYERFTRVNAKYGKVLRCFYNWSRTRQAVLLADLKLAKQVFCSSAWLNRTLDSQNYFGYMMSFNKAIGILTGNGQHWKESRKVVVKLLRDHNLLDPSHTEDLYSTEIRPVLHDLHQKIEQSGEGSVIFSPRHLFVVPVMNVSLKMLFGRGLNEEEKAKGGLVDQIIHVNATNTLLLSSVEFFPFLKYFPSFTFMGPFIKCCQKIYDTAEVEANKRKIAEKYTDEPKDLLDSLLKQVDQSQGKNPNYFTFQALQVNVRDLLMAGGETIAAQMEHLIQQMAMNPHVQRKVQDQIDQVIGPERWPTYDDKNSMIYTQATILESLRFGSIVPFTGRTCTQDNYELRNLKIKKGTHVGINYYAIHHSAEVWTDPEVFRPERFLNEKNEIVNTEKMIPFCYGPRSCPGEQAARVALFIFTVVLLREFSWDVSPVHPPPSLRLIKGVTRYPAPYFVKMTKRKPN